MKLTSRLQLSFLLLGALSITLTGWQAYESARDALERVTLDRLVALREAKKQQVEAWYRNRTGRLTVLAAQQPLQALAGGAVASREMRDAVLTTARLSGFDMVIVASPDGGVLIDSDTPPRSGGRPAAGDMPAILHEALLLGLRADSGTAVMTDLSWDVPVDGRPAAFMATPLRARGHTAGVLIVRCGMDEVNTIMTERSNWENSGLGRSGETYLVGTDGTMRSDSRFLLEQPAGYIASLPEATLDSAQVARMREHGSTILIQRVPTVATQEALAGRTGMSMIDDYRGIAVASSYTPLNFPVHPWVIIAEIDHQEAFRSITSLRERLIQAGLIILLIAAILAVVISRSIARPVRALSRAAEQIGRGELTQRIEIASRDEIAELAGTFNTMAANLLLHMERLEAEILERGRAEERLHESREQLRKLSAHLQTVREEERRGVAREVHDELGQALTTLKLHLALVADAIPMEADTVHARIRSMSELIDGTIHAVRRIITELRPGLLDDLGLAAAIEWQAEEFQRRTGIACTVEQQDSDTPPPPELAISVFRIFQETLTNVVRHSGADRVEVRLSCGDALLELDVHDNGRGMTADERDASSSFGLIGMRERAHAWGGTVEFDSDPHRGTRVSVRIPHIPPGSPA